MQHLLREIPGLTAAKIEMLREHWRLLLASADRTDLTRLTTPDDIAIKHYLDCALPLKFVQLPSPLLDIGSGAGFPGLVLKILSPETEVILGEVRPKRTEFLQHAIDVLGLKGVSVFAHRIGPQFPHAVQGVVTRALESARDTLYRVQPFLPTGGKVLLLKGPKGDAEIAEALAELNDFRHEQTFSYRLAVSRHERQLIVFKREKESIRQMPAIAKTATVHRLEITSRANETFKSLLSLADARGIRKESKFLVSGQKLVEEILTTPRRSTTLESVIVEPRHEIPEGARRVLVLAPQLFREVDVLGTGQPLALMAIPELHAWQGDSLLGVTVFLPFQDPGNVGAAIRSAVAFGVRRVVLLKEAASPFLPKAVRAAANALFEVELLSGPSLDALVESDTNVWRLDAQGEEITKAEFKNSVLLLPGVEGFGFRKTGATAALRIPISDKIESLNAQTALAIALYEIERRLKTS